MRQKHVEKEIGCILETSFPPSSSIVKLGRLRRSLKKLPAQNGATFLRIRGSTNLFNIYDMLDVAKCLG